MTYIIQRDQHQFVLRPYRETLRLKGAVLKKEINHIARNNGNFVLLLKAGYETEAIFSKEPGQLFAETVWRIFENPSNLIFCEFLTDSDELALIVVRDNKIYFDEKVTVNQLQQTLIAFNKAKNKFIIKIFDPQKRLQSLKPLFNNLAEQLTELSASVINNLPHDKNLELVPLEQLLQQQEFSKNIKIFVAGLCLVLFAAGYIFWDQLFEYEQHHVQIKQIDPLEQYRLLLRAAGPAQQIHALSQFVTKMRLIPGWEINSIKFNNNQLIIKLSSIGGLTSHLVAWSKKQQANIEFGDDGITLTKNFLLPNRDMPVRLQDSQQILSLIIDRLMKVLPGKAVQVNNTVQNGMFKQVSISIQLNRVNLQVLDLVSKQLKHLPLVLQSIQLTQTDHTINGMIKLDILGK